MNAPAEWVGGVLLPVIASKGTVLVLMAGGTALVLRRASGAQGHLIWLSCLASLAALPVLTLLLPHWNLAVLPPATRDLAPVEAPPTPSLLRPASVYESRSERLKSLMDTRRVRPSASIPALKLLSATEKETIQVHPEQAGFALDSQKSEFSGTPPLPVVLAPRPAATVFVAWIWLVGCGVAVLPIVWRLWALSRLRAACRPFPDIEIRDMADRLCCEAGLTRTVLIAAPPLWSPPLPPMTWGVRRPVVLLPASAKNWPEERLHAVLLHELAHVRRGDWLSLVFAQTVCALYWFHPAVWFAADRLRREAERACDDSVLRAGVPPKQYANALLEIVRAMKQDRSNRALSHAGVGMARRAQLESRLRSVLETGTSRVGASRRTLTFAACACAALALPLAALRVVAQDAPVPPVPSEAPVLTLAPTPPVAPKAPRARRLASHFAPGEARLSVAAPQDEDGNTKENRKKSEDNKDEEEPFRALEGLDDLRNLDPGDVLKDVDIKRIAEEAQRAAEEGMARAEQEMRRALKLLDERAKSADKADERDALKRARQELERSLAELSRERGTLRTHLRDDVSRSLRAELQALREQLSAMRESIQAEGGRGGAERERAMEKARADIERAMERMRGEQNRAADRERGQREQDLDRERSRREQPRRSISAAPASRQVLEQRLRLLQTEARHLEALVKAREERVKAGIAEPEELDRAKADLERNKAEIERTRTLLDSARRGRREPTEDEVRGVEQQARVRTLEARVVAQKRLAALMEQRVRLGETPVLELDAAKAEQARLELELLSAREELRRTQRASAERQIAESRRAVDLAVEMRREQERAEVRARLAR